MSSFVLVCHLRSNGILRPPVPPVATLPVKSQRIWAEKSTLSVWKSLVNGYIFFGSLTILMHYIAYYQPLYYTLGPIVSTVYSPLLTLRWD